VDAAKESVLTTLSPVTLFFTAYLEGDVDEVEAVAQSSTAHTEEMLGELSGLILNYYYYFNFNKLFGGND